MWGTSVKYFWLILFYLITGSHVWTQLFSDTSQVIYHFYFVSDCISNSFLFHFLFHYCFWTRTLPNFQPMKPGQYPTFWSIHSLASIHSQFCFEYIHSHFITLCSQILNLAISSNFHTFSLRSKMMCWLLNHQIIWCKCISSNLCCHNICFQFPSPIQIAPFLFQGYLQIVNPAFLKAEIQKGRVLRWPCFFSNKPLAKRHPKSVP